MTKKMELKIYLLKTVILILVNKIIIKKKEKEYSLGKMVNNMTEIGNMISIMEKDY